MKLMYNVAALLLTGVIAVSCNDNEKTKEATTTQDTTVTTTVASTTDTTVKVALTAPKTTVIEAAQVPEKVNKTFAAKYPKASKVEWMTYEPVEYDNLPDPQYYYVRFNNDGVDYYNWYTSNGDWVKTSTAFVGGNSKLPEAVNKMIAEQYPGYEISEIDKENDKDMDMYEIELNKGESKVKLKVLPDGTIFKKKEK